MNGLLSGALGALLATNQPVAVSNLINRTLGVSVDVRSVNDPVQREYLALLAADDAAQTEVDTWIKENEAFTAKGAGLDATALSSRIEQRFRPVHKAYQAFMDRHPRHAEIRLAYGSFLNDIGEEYEANKHWEKAKELDPKNPAAWNNLANFYGHRGPVTKAFEYYAKAIELNPKESVYYQNLATTVFLFRPDARDHYKLTEQQVFDRALELYRKALELDPSDFLLAADVARTYYGIQPPRTEEALKAWNYALKVANDDLEREGVYLHLARIELNSGRFEQAHQHLGLVTNEMYAVLKGRLTRNLAEKEKKAAQTE